MVSLSITLQHKLTIFGPSIVHDMHMSTVHVSPDLDLMFTDVLLPLFILTPVSLRFGQFLYYKCTIKPRFTKFNTHIDHQGYMPVSHLSHDLDLISIQLLRSIDFVIFTSSLGLGQICYNHATYAHLIWSINLFWRVYVHQPGLQLSLDLVFIFIVY
jgi:hypothetical protein